MHFFVALPPFLIVNSFNDLRITFDTEGMNWEKATQSALATLSLDFYHAKACISMALDSAQVD
jgi:hypothetical protein